MQKIGFSEAVDRILAEDPRYHRDVYAFVRDALDFTVKQQKKGREGLPKHVTPAQLLDGVRNFALKEFGPMVPSVFGYWNINSCEDLGHIVFNMIRKEILGKNESDTIEQFRAGYDFHEAFVAPFQPDPAPKPPIDPATPITPAPSHPAGTGS
jgi:uncharacterized repeat protein (TIGR04138 family)